ncbi:uncharacterized protein LOC121866446 [Homarus americanus]|uniref:uncharacterized protein LOC121866446 n=1 Tax=Homarus americanus TaxID=6706 RepID=UPI001C4928BC|nr:uncharacterized protein LOC121866446 [Homarus americanus]
MDRWTNNFYKQQSGGVVAGDGVVESRGHQGSLTANSRRRRSSHGRIEGRKVAHLWVFRVVHLTEVTLKSFVERQGIQVFNVEQVSHREAAYKSFLLTVDERDAVTLLQRTFWPGLVACRLWHDRGDGRRGDAFSRRSARGTRTVLEALDSQVGGGQQKGRDGSFHTHTNTYRSTRYESPPCKERHRTITQVGSGLKSNNRERKYEEKKGKYNNGLRKDNKNNSDKEGKGDNSNKLVGISKLGSKTKTTIGKSDKSVKSKETKPKDNKEKVDKNKIKRKEKHIGEKVSRRNKEPDKGGKTAGYKKREVSRVSDRATDRGDVNKRSKDKHNENKKPPDDKDKMQAKSAEHKGYKRHVGDNETVDKQYDEKYTHDERGNMRKKIDKQRGSTTQHVKGKHWNQGPETHDHPRKDGSVRTSMDTHYSKNPNKSVVQDTTDVNSIEKEKTEYPNWVMSLSTLLILSSEEVVYKLLGPDYDELLGQEDIADDELFLGVKVLAHSARAKSSQDDLIRLLNKIWQPHIINLIKTFSVTVERRYPERAERYFWDLAEFLDLCIVSSVFIEGMCGLLSTCVSEVLALNYKSYVSDDLVKVYRRMQEKCGRLS